MKLMFCSPTHITYTRLNATSNMSLIVRVNKYFKWNFFGSTTAAFVIEIRISNVNKKKNDGINGNRLNPNSGFNVNTIFPME